MASSAVVAPGVSRQQLFLTLEHTADPEGVSELERLIHGQCGEWVLRYVTNAENRDT